MNENALPGSGRRRAIRALVRMTARSRDEPHRTATPLELLFDLCFVVAVAQAGGRLVHAVAEGDAGHGITGYLFVFFAIWWAWVNFTWFASAYDCDDVPYRIATLVQICCSSPPSGCCTPGTTSGPSHNTRCCPSARCWSWPARSPGTGPCCWPGW